MRYRHHFLSALVAAGFTFLVHFSLQPNSWLIVILGSAAGAVLGLWVADRAFGKPNHVRLNRDHRSLPFEIDYGIQIACTILFLSVFASGTLYFSVFDGVPYYQSGTTYVVLLIFSTLLSYLLTILIMLPVSVFLTVCLWLLGYECEIRVLRHLRN